MKSTQSRLYWVDHLRTFMILLVVNIHACVTYSHVGSWYYMIDPEPPFLVKLVFAVWEAHLQAFFMGLLFFLAGYFANRSLTRHGPRRFLAERWLRLGVPTLIYMLLIHPFILLGLDPWHDARPPLVPWLAHYLGSRRFIGASGPLWFAFALLIFSAMLTLIRVIRPVGEHGVLSAADDRRAVRLTTVLGLGLVIGLASFLVRTVQPIGESVLNFQLCFFPQYVAAFGLGIAISRRDALQSLAESPVALNAGRFGLPCCLLLFGVLFALGGAPPDHASNPYFGGWHVQALGYALWEQFTGLCLALACLAMFRRRWNRDNAALRWMSDRSFGVYVWHAPILIALTMWFQHLHGNLFALAALLSLAALVASFLFVDLLRRLPGMRAIF